MATKMKLTKLTITADDNPLTWTPEKWAQTIGSRVAVGYFITGKPSQCITLYLQKTEDVKNGDDIVSQHHLCLAFMQWIDMLSTKKNAVMFKNPPFEAWLMTKLEWCRAQARKFSKQFDRDFDECLSNVYMTITNCYNKGTIYMGSLFYLEKAIQNDFRKEYNFWRNRITGETYGIIALDAEVKAGDGDDKLMCYHELIGACDKCIEDKEFECTKEELCGILKEEFSQREIDQIINCTAGFLPASLYRRLNKWRKENRREYYGY